MKRSLRIGVVGGGIGGAALVNSLSRYGLEAHLFERAPAFGEVGAGVQMTPNAVKVLNALGFDEKLKEYGFLPDSLVGRNWKSGKELFRMPLYNTCKDLYGADFYHIHRADLHGMFVDRLKEGQYSLGKTCIGAENCNDVAVARFEDGQEYEADLIVGADGVRSAVRTQIFGDDKPGFTGHMCWRALVPFDEMPDYVTPDSSFWLGPNGHVVTYYVKGGKAVNIVAVMESSAWVEESWNAPSSREELLNAYKGWHPNLIKLFSRAEDVFKWGLFDRDPMPTWSQGRITLLGDAAHPMLPFLSQGAAMAIEDGYVLASALDKFNGDIAAALKAYEKDRIPRTSRVQLESRERGRTYHLPTVWEQFKRDVIYRVKGLFNPHASGIKANWVYEYDATTCQSRMSN